MLYNSQTSGLSADQRPILRYLTGMKVLYKGAPLPQNPIYKLIGPTRSALQGLNGLTRGWGCKMLIRSPVGTPRDTCCFRPHKHIQVGDLEATFTMAAYRAANLERTMESKDIPDSAKLLVESFSKVSTEDSAAASTTAWRSLISEDPLAYFYSITKDRPLQRTARLLDALVFPICG